MSYPWECRDCFYLDTNDVKWGDMYCKAKRRYVDPCSTSCSNDFKKTKEAESRGTCYLTTCMCNILGKKDNCNTLNTLRDFRDNYMKKDEKYNAILDDYKVVGPMISDKIIDDENSYEVATIMKNNYIDEAIEFISLGNYQDAVSIYIDMTVDLMDYYDIDTDILRTNEYGLYKEEIKTRKRMGSF